MTIGEVLIKGYETLKRENIESYMLDCQLLLCNVLRKDKLFIIINRNYEISDDEALEYFRLVEQRKERMPVKYILGECEFMGINFKIRKGVLIPRPDTEVLVEEAIRFIRQNHYNKVCDVCCGSGIIGLSMTKLIPWINTHCCDISRTACNLTEENAKLLSIDNRIEVFQSDLLEFALNAGVKYDVVVSNPPYISEKVIPDLMRDVREYEPYEALCGGEDGLDFYRKISDQSRNVLNQNGLIAMEIGYDQAVSVEHILNDNGFEEINCLKDLAGNDRVITGKIKF